MARWNSGGRKRTLSRDERSALYGEAGFAPIQDKVRCPSCRDNELSAPSVYDPEARGGRSIGARVTFSCEEEDCVMGWIPAYGKKRLDPYMTQLARNTPVPAHG